jgi:hypothetical protein
MSKYTRTATSEEMLALPEEEQKILCTKCYEMFLRNEILTDPDTFLPFIIIDEVRYNIEIKESGE